MSTPATKKPVGKKAPATKKPVGKKAPAGKKPAATTPPPTPAPAPPAKKTPTKRKKATAQKPPEDAKTEGSARGPWIIAAIFLLIALIAIGKMVMSGSGGGDRESVNPAPAVVHDTTPPTPAPTDNTKTTDSKPETAEEEVVLPAAKLEGVVRRPHGAIIRSLGPVETRGGERYRLLQTTTRPDETGRHRVMLYPENRPLDEIQRHMTFEGFQPPPGDLVIFDRVNGMHVFAWRLR